jgi:hypothetical protein
MPGAALPADLNSGKPAERLDSRFRRSDSHQFWTNLPPSVMSAKAGICFRHHGAGVARTDSGFRRNDDFKFCYEHSTVMPAKAGIQ